MGASQGSFAYANPTVPVLGAVQMGLSLICISTGVTLRGGVSQGLICICTSGSTDVAGPHLHRRFD